MHWRGERHAVEQLPASMSFAARSAVEAVAPWAADHEYRLDLEDSGRVLLVTRQEASTERALGLVERTIAWFDEQIPAPSSSSVRTYRRVEAPTTGAAVDSGAVPEDPDDDAPWKVAGFGANQGRSRSVPETQTRWGADDVVPDTQTAIFFVVRDERDYKKLLAFVAKLQPYLKSWTRAARKQQGFALQAPLAGAYIELAEGQEEWNADNELVNRLTQLLSLRRFGPLPNWLQQGIAWNAEVALLGAIYCFPFREEFVWATEHTGWDRAVEVLVSRREDAVEPKEFLGWKRGRYDDEAAKLSWAGVRLLLEKPAGELSAIARTLAEFRDHDNRIHETETSWKRDPAYVLPVEDQRAILESYLGGEVWQEWTQRFRSFAD